MAATNALIESHCKIVSAVTEIFQFESKALRLNAGVMPGSIIAQNRGGLQHICLLLQCCWLRPNDRAVDLFRSQNATSHHEYELQESDLNSQSHLMPIAHLAVFHY